jgi:hypothetical protein
VRSWSRGALQARRVHHCIGHIGLKVKCMHERFHTSLRGGALEIRVHQAYERGCSKVGGTTRIEEGTQESWGTLIKCKGFYFKETIQGKQKGN